MSLRITSTSSAIGSANDLSIARGEDREFHLEYTEADGTGFDFSDAVDIMLAVKNPSDGEALFTRRWSGFAAASTPIFRIFQADTDNVPDGTYDLDVIAVDAAGYKTQLQLASRLRILKRVTAPGDAVTTPPAIPVTYGLTWHPGMWSHPTGGYNVNDAVAAFDGSLGTTAISSFRAMLQGVTYYPISPTGTLATGWGYICRPGG